jgi:DNA-directed RNA polymerase subunit RPC12/RpoP
MHVICKNCGSKIAVASRPSGSTTLTGVQATNVNVGDGAISFGPGGSISFGPGGSIGFGGPVPSTFSCMSCSKSAQYLPSEILND